MCVPFLDKDTNLLSKVDLSSPDQHDLAIHIDITFPQLGKVTLLPILRIQDGTLDQNTKPPKINASSGFWPFSASKK